MCKIVQTESAVGLLVEELDGSGTFHFWHIPLLSRLRVVDSCTGSNLQAILLDEQDIWGLQCARERAENKMDISTADRASANDSAEEGMANTFPENLRLRLPCVAHIASSVQGRSFNAIAFVIKHIISCSLAMRPAGAVQAFREQLISVLVGSVLVHDAPCPAPGHPARVHREAIFNLAFPPDSKAILKCLLWGVTPEYVREIIMWRWSVLFKTSGSVSMDCFACLWSVCGVIFVQAAIERNTTLCLLLNGDLESEVIDWYVPGSSGKEVDTRSWAKSVACILLPAAIRPFHKQRWCNSLAPLASYMLLANCHRLLQRVVPRWLLVLDGKIVQPYVRSVYECVKTDFDVSDEEDEEIVDILVVNGPQDGGQHDVAEAWQRFNNRQRKGASELVRSEPADRLVIGTITMALSVSFLHNVEGIASRNWDRTQWVKCLNGEVPTTRMVAAHRGDLSRQVFEKKSHSSG